MLIVYFIFFLMKISRNFIANLSSYRIWQILQRISFNFINSISFIFPNLKLYKKEIFYIISLYNSTYCLKFSNRTHCIISYIITHRDVKNFQIILSTLSVPFSTKNRVFKFQEKFFLPLSYRMVSCIRILLARQVQWISIRWAIDTVAL